MHGKAHHCPNVPVGPQLKPLKSISVWNEWEVDHALKQILPEGPLCIKRNIF